MTGAGYDYGKAARIGVATPQANPTVEAEFSLLYPRSVAVQTSRLVCASGSTNERLVSYIEDLGTTIASYGGMRLSALGFACTGSSYLVGREREAAILDALAKDVAYPIVTATHAILHVLKSLGAARIAIVAPYPQDLIDNGARYWQSCGIEVTAMQRIITRTSNTETIYELSSAEAIEALATFDPNGADAILISGTGMPSLACIASASHDIPVVSSNLCLAWRLLDIARASRLALRPAPEIMGWRERYAEMVSASDQV